MTSISPAFSERDFRKASASNPDRQCVRVARRDGWVEVRDDKTVFGAPDDVRLVFTEAQFDDFLTGVRSGRATGRCLEMLRRDDGTYVFRSTLDHNSAELVFTEAEVNAFLDGVNRGEFDRFPAQELAVGA
ncbi:DUF397 domain-containing protein [Saccharopolyspora rosea]|uniref:DUF397 domain-containing protein n=1 Tax=Saccharopolyspora rosea TaxID=524884 RepID=A0ABW3FU74_9PSEU|nr:DUF397 domain-containing protein [Saccharopolyspora rosea]